MSAVLAQPEIEPQRLDWLADEAVTVEPVSLQLWEMQGDSDKMQGALT